MRWPAEPPEPAPLPSLRVVIDFGSTPFDRAAIGRLGDRLADLVNVPVDAFAGLPPTMVVTSQRDPLRVEGTVLAERLAEAGVEVDHLHVQGVMHEFFGCGAVLDKAADAMAQAASFIRAKAGTDKVLGVR